MEIFFIHLPGAMLLISLMSSVILCGISNRRIATFIYKILAIFSLISALIILIFIKKDFIYSFGNWTDGIGIDISVNHTSALFIAINSIIYFITAQSITSCKKVKTSLFGFCGLVFTGLCGLILTVDWFNFYVFLELTSISLYVLLTADYGEGKSYSSAFNYLIIGSIANIFILLGIFFIYSSTGTLNMEITSKIIASKKMTANSHILMQASYILIITGLLTKSALYPLHSWIMNCYINMPSVVTAFVAAIVTKIAMFNIYKINNIFGYDFVAIELRYFIVIIFVLCYLAIIICSLGALFDSHLKTILAFSSMAQSGYILLGFFSFNRSVISGIFLQILVHSLAIATLFMIIGAIEKQFDCKIDINTSNFQRCLRNETLLKFSFVIALFSIVGFPMTLGFIAKWYILSGFYLASQYISFAVIIVGGGIGMLYSWRLVEYLFFQKYAEIQIGEYCEIRVDKIPKTIKIMVFIVALLIVFLSIFNDYISKIILLAV